MAQTAEVGCCEYIMPSLLSTYNEPVFVIAIMDRLVSKLLSVRGRPVDANALMQVHLNEIIAPKQQRKNLRRLIKTLQKRA